MSVNRANKPKNSIILRTQVSEKFRRFAEHEVCETAADVRALQTSCWSYTWALSFLGAPGREVNDSGGLERRVPAHGQAWSRAA